MPQEKEALHKTCIDLPSTSTIVLHSLLLPFVGDCIHLLQSSWITLDCQTPFVTFVSHLCCAIVIGNSRFLQRPQKRSRGSQLIHRRLTKTKLIGRGSRSRETDIIFELLSAEMKMVTKAETHFVFFRDSGVERLDISCF